MILPPLSNVSDPYSVFPSICPQPHRSQEPLHRPRPARITTLRLSPSLLASLFPPSLTIPSFLQTQTSISILPAIHLRIRDPPSPYFLCIASLQRGGEWWSLASSGHAIHNVTVYELWSPIRNHSERMLLSIRNIIRTKVEHDCKDFADFASASADFGFQNAYDCLDISLLRQPVLSNYLAMLMTAACAASRTDQESQPARPWGGPCSADRPPWRRICVLICNGNVRQRGREARGEDYRGGVGGGKEMDDMSGWSDTAHAWSHPWRKECHDQRGLRNEISGPTTTLAEARYHFL